VYLAGGEPLLIKENITLLNKLYELKPDIEIRINTNLSIINNTVYNLIKKFKNVHWTISVDSIGEEFEYVRYGGSWSKFVKNLHQLRQDFEKINFNSCWFVLNGSSILDCIDYLQNLGFHENTFIVNPIEDPVEWHISNLPAEVIEDIKIKIKKKLTTTNPKYSLYNSLNLMLNYTNVPFDKNIEATFTVLRGIDQRRKLDSSKIFKELYHGKTI
jgi:sulfatase maturation enzyme AslB (radical SAM superfamily)